LKNYGDVVALDNVSLKIRSGEILTVIGPNGAGKTTLLRIMAFIERPTRGEMFFGGEKVDEENRDRFRLRSTLVFQRTALFNADVYNNVSYGLKIRGFPKHEIDEKVGEVLELVKLDGYEGRLVKKLSGGEQQRVSLARALALDTDLLLLDEPTANLDPRSASIIEDTISRVNRDYGTTIVVATHNMFQAKTISGILALLLGGRLVEVGSPDEIFERASKELLSFARVENLFSGDASIVDDGNSVIDIGGGVKIEAASALSGRVSVYVRPEDIILSKRSISSSARNTFTGSIVEVSDLGSIVKLRIDAGREFVVQITKRSFVEMGLNLSSKVYLTFKASSVRTV